MRRRDYEKQLLRQRIESQRRMTGLELRSATDGLGRLHKVTRIAREVMPVLAPVTRAVGGLGPNTRRLLFVTIAAAALAPVVRSFFRR